MAGVNVRHRLHSIRVGVSTSTLPLLTGPFRALRVASTAEILGACANRLVVHNGSLTPRLSGGEKMAQADPDANSDILLLVSPMMFYATATQIGNSVGGNTFRKTWVDNSKPAHNICFRGSSATNRLTIAPAYYGNEPERSETWQIFRV